MGCRVSSSSSRFRSICSKMKLMRAESDEGFGFVKSMAALARVYGPILHLRMWFVHVVAASARAAEQFLKAHDGNSRAAGPTPANPRSLKSPSAAAQSNGWWAPLFGWSSEPDYINVGVKIEADRTGPGQSEHESDRIDPDRTIFRGCSTEEKGDDGDRRRRPEEIKGERLAVEVRGPPGVLEESRLWSADSIYG